MHTVAVVGVGLIGGSFALALQRAGFSGRILGVSSERSCSLAIQIGAIHESVTLEEAAAEADLIYLAQPIHGIIDAIQRLHGIVQEGCLVTDGGSTKELIVREASKKLPLFLGGHPMAGKTARGVQEADPGLFDGKTYVITPQQPSDLNQAEIQSFLTWIRKIGANVMVLSPEAHDRTVAVTSHLPQLASTALAAVLAEQGLTDEQFLVAGAGLADTTRLAASSFDVWRDILTTNTREIDRVLASYIDKLSEFRQNLTNPALRNDFEAAAISAAKVRR